MTKIDIFSGFLGAGKTTLIKKLIQEAYSGENIVLIENEFGKIGIDGGFMKEAGIQVNELNSGCICCSLVGDFGKALRKVEEEYHPDRILIEPSGVGKLSDVVRAVQSADLTDAYISGSCTVVDASKCKIYMKNFGEFFDDQVEHATTILLSHTAGISQEKLDTAVKLLREKNDHAVLVTTDWDALTGQQILAAMEQKNTIADLLHELEHEEIHEHEHHHHHDGEKCDDPDCECHHHHDEDEHEHHHHHDGEECDDPDCECHHHHDGDEHHHHADEIFESFGMETAKTYTPEEIRHILQCFVEDATYGTVLRAKGILPGKDGKWIHFDYVPGEPDVRFGAADVTGRFCVIGTGLEKEKIKVLFGL